MQSSAFLIFAFGYFFFGVLVVVWFRKKKKAGGKISGWVKAVVISFGLMGPSIFLSMIELSPAPETNVPVVGTTYYVKSGGANVRECPEILCKVIDELSQNTPLTFPGDLYDKYPEWVEITFPDGKLGYVSKTVLFSGSPIKSPPQGDGIELGEGDFEPLIVGNSYGFSFCVPESSRSGATCGGLAGATQSPVGGSPPYSLIKGSGFFPPGMALELNGWFFGSPNTEGTYNFQICAKDLQMNRGCQNYTLVVKKNNTISLPLPPVETKSVYSALLTFSADEPDPSFGGSSHISGRVVFDPQSAAPSGGLSFRGSGTYEYSTVGCSSSTCLPGCWNTSDGTFGISGNITTSNKGVYLDGMYLSGSGRVIDRHSGQEDTYSSCQSGGPERLLSCIIDADLKYLLGGNTPDTPDGVRYNLDGETKQFNRSEGTYYCSNLSYNAAFILTKE